MLDRALCDWVSSWRKHTWLYVSVQVMLKMTLLLKEF